MRFASAEVNDGFGRVSGSVSLEVSSGPLLTSHSLTGDGEIVIVLGNPGNDGRQMHLSLSPALLDALLDEGHAAMSNPAVIASMAGDR